MELKKELSFYDMQVLHILFKFYKNLAPGGIEFILELILFIEFIVENI